MARRSDRRSPRARAWAVPPRPGAIPIATGTAELVDGGDGITIVLVNEVPSSTIAADPDQLEFEYMANVSAAVAAWGGGETMLALHIGGGACTLPRHLAHAYPQSRHVVVEADAEIARLAREWSELPRAPRLRIRVGDGLDTLRERADGSVDLILRDAFAGRDVPAHLTSDEWWAEARRVLRPDGVVVANMAARPRERDAQDDARAAAGRFRTTVGVGDPGVLGGTRIGNVVLVAGDDVPLAGLARYAASAPLPTVTRPAWPSAR